MVTRTDFYDPAIGPSFTSSNGWDGRRCPPRTSKQPVRDVFSNWPQVKRACRKSNFDRNNGATVLDSHVIFFRRINGIVEIVRVIRGDRDTEFL